MYGLPKAAVDGNVFRVVTRLLADPDDITKAGTRKKIEDLIGEAIPRECPGDFNQGLIELGAIICLPNGAPKCGECPLNSICRACAQGTQLEFPVKKKAKARRVEKRTVFLFCDSSSVAIRKRPDEGLLAGLYEFPNVEGYLDQKEVIEYAKTLGLAPIRVKQLGNAKHIFSHVEWHMRGYEILVDELEKSMTGDVIFAGRRDLEEKYPMPSAFEAFTSLIMGKRKDKKRKVTF